MRSTNTFGVTFYPKQNRNQRKDYSIIATISCNDSPPRDITIKGTFQIKDWDKGKGQPKQTTDELREFTTYLKKVEAKLTAIFQELELKEEILTAENIKAYYLGKGATQSQMTILQLAELAHEDAKVRLKKGSYKNYNATKTYLTNFCVHTYPAKDLSLKKLDFNFIDSFYTYILQHPIKPNDPLEKNGAYKHIERLKKMVKWAGNKGWCEKHVFEGFTASKTRPETHYLTWEQLQAVENVYIINPITNYIRKLFLFCCYTGMAPIDMQTLLPEQISRDMYGNVWMQYTRVKSTIPAWVPLLDKAKEILAEIGLEPGSTIRKTVFKYYSNKVLNDHMKIISMLCGISFEIEFYWARHTFGTTITIQMGVPVEVLQIMMGHEKLETTQIYARVGNPLVLMYMQRVQSLINSGGNMGLQGIGEAQFAALLEQIAPNILAKIFNEVLLPKLTEVVQMKSQAPDPVKQIESAA